MCNITTRAALWRRIDIFLDQNKGGQFKTSVIYFKFKSQKKSKKVKKTIELSKIVCYNINIKITRKKDSISQEMHLEGKRLVILTLKDTAKIFIKRWGLKVVK